MLLISTTLPLPAIRAIVTTTSIVLVIQAGRITPSVAGLPTSKATVFHLSTDLLNSYRVTDTTERLREQFLLVAVFSRSARGSGTPARTPVCGFWYLYQGRVLVAAGRDRSLAFLPHPISGRRRTQEASSEGGITAAIYIRDSYLLLQPRHLSQRNGGTPVSSHDNVSPM